MDEAEDVPEEDTPPQQQVIKSARRGMHERRNSRINRTAQQLVSPYQTLRDMNIVTADENGNTIIDLSCLGRGQPHWYAVGIMENKEDRYLELLAEVMDEYGISFNPKTLYMPPAPGDAAAAAEAAALLEINEVTAWVPSKTMMVYSHNTDKLVERVVHYGRGTGGAWLLLHMTLDPLLVDLVQETYYYLGWRHEQEVSARMLEQAGILPRGEDREEVYKLPVPCTPQVLQQLTSWQFTEESEDLEQKRQEYYGIGSGSVFGEIPTKAERLQGMERDAAGNIVQKRYSSGTYDNPSGWSEGSGSSSSSRGGRGSSSRGGRGGGRGQAGRGSWQQQPLPWEDQQQRQQSGWAVAGSDRGFDGYDNTGYNNNHDFRNNSRNNNVSKKGGRDPTVRLQQLDYMKEMGSGRYSGGDSDFDWQQQQQQGFSGRDSFVKPKGGRDDSIRHQQIDFMGEMGSDRYSDDDEKGLDNDEGLTGLNDRSNSQAGFRKQPQGDSDDLGFINPKPQGAGYVREKGLGGKGDRVRQRQIDYMEEMGSERYSSDDDHDQDHDWLPSSSGRGSSSSSSFLGDVAAAFEGLGQDAAGLFDQQQQQQQQQQNLGRRQQQQQQQRDFAGPGKASFMDEDSLAWGDDDSVTAARQQYTSWQQDNAALDGFQALTSSDLDFDDFSNDDFSNDELLQQLAQVPPQDVLPKTVEPRQPPAAAAAARPKAAAAARPKAAAAAGPKAAAAAKKTKRVSKAAKNAAAKGHSNEEGLGFGGVGSDDEGFEQGWVERLMSDGKDRVGLDDVMKE